MMNFALNLLIVSSALLVDSIAFSKELAVQPDLSADLSFRQITSQPMQDLAQELGDCRFSTRKDWHFGFTDNVVWAKFTLKNTTSSQVDRVFYLGHIYLSELDLYSGSNCESLQRLHRMGLNSQQEGFLGAIGGYAAQISIPAKSSQTFYVRARSKYPISLPIEVMEHSEYQNQVHSTYLVLTFYLAFVIALMLYNLILGFITKERTFFYYALTILSLHLFTNLAQYGLVKEHVLPSFIFLHDNIFHLAHLFSLISVTLFISAFLSSSLRYSQLRGFWALALAQLPLALAGILTDLAFIDAVMQLITTVYCLSLLFVVAVLALRQQSRPAQYFFFAWAFLILSWLINFFKISGHIPSTPLADTLILFGAGAECLLLSLAIADRIRTLTAERAEVINNLAITNERNSIFRQVSHDIRSPLSALNMVVGTTKEMPEDRRLLIKNAIQRINDIANGLLQQGKHNEDTPLQSKRNLDSSLSSEPVMLIATLDAIVSEKRVQYREQMNIEIQGDLNGGYGLFAEVNATEFSRVISNLVNNSVEAFSDGGRVTIGISGDDKNVVIKVIDNGKGIPPHITPRLGQRGVTHGKEGTLSGSGLGIWHAKTTVEKFGGSLQIQSSESVGTQVSIALPRSPIPHWFFENIVLARNSILISLDDDATVHQIWANRLAGTADVPADIRHLSFTSLDNLETWMSTHSYGAALFLVDYEFLGQKINGLDAIERLGIADQAVLVTSHFDEPKVMAKARESGVRILPKSLAPFVPIIIEKTVDVYDAVLIDDDPLVHMTWKLAAKHKNKRLICFYRPEEFLLDAKKIHANTPLYIDVELGDGVCGATFAQAATSLGFKKVQLATGQPLSRTSTVTSLRKVVGKDPDF